MQLQQTIQYSMQVVQDQEEHCSLCSRRQKGPGFWRRRVLLRRYVRLRLLNHNSTLITQLHLHNIQHKTCTHCTLYHLYNCTLHTHWQQRNESFLVINRVLALEQYDSFLNQLWRQLLIFNLPAFILDWPKYFTFVCNFIPRQKDDQKIVKLDLYIYSVYFTHYNLHKNTLNLVRRLMFYSFCVKCTSDRGFWLFRMDMSSFINAMTVPIPA